MSENPSRRKASEGALEAYESSPALADLAFTFGSSTHSMNCVIVQPFACTPCLNLARHNRFWGWMWKLSTKFEGELMMITFRGCINADAACKGRAAIGELQRHSDVVFTASLCMLCRNGEEKCQAWVVQCVCACLGTILPRVCSATYIIDPHKSCWVRCATNEGLCILHLQQRHSSLYEYTHGLMCA